MADFDDPVMREMEKAVDAHKRKIDRTIEAFIAEGMAKGEIREEHFERAPNGDSWFRMVDQEGVAIVFNYTRRTVHSYGGGANWNESALPRQDG